MRKRRRPSVVIFPSSAILQGVSQCTWREQWTRLDIVSRFLPKQDIILLIGKRIACIINVIKVRSVYKENERLRRKEEHSLSLMKPLCRRRKIDELLVPVHSVVSLKCAPESSKTISIFKHCFDFALRSNKLARLFNALTLCRVKICVWNEIISSVFIVKFKIYIRNVKKTVPWNFLGDLKVLELGNLWIFCFLFEGPSNLCHQCFFPKHYFELHNSSCPTNINQRCRNALLTIVIWFQKVLSMLDQMCNQNS